ncbi:hypothetical protein AXF42_Ash000665 [Apostasia shenzhenica]|uniref:Uncharacterized protein n=1 Tax=Apostasia shenzhenica TaxID=1088818 RepID=A0A2I0AH24_9ASPA|nr:hypothetical protein AXF42_Ash000665 [Apostasia shenzhenica]
MASNSSLVLLLPLFLFTAMVAIAAAQPPAGFRIATLAERLYLTYLLRLRAYRLNFRMIRNGVLATTGAMRMISRINIDRAFVMDVGPRRYCLLEVVANAFDYRTVPAQSAPSLAIRDRVVAIVTVIVLNGNFYQAEVRHLDNFLPPLEP